MLNRIYLPDKIMKKLIVLLFIPIIVFSQSLNKDFLLSQTNKVELNENFKLPQSKEFVKKKTGLAILYSFLLPGMGELYAGSYESGKYFTTADGVFWGALVGFNVYGKWQEDNYKDFATTMGGASIVGKDDKFFADLGNYLDVYQYNTSKELDRRFDETYDEVTHYWKWRDQTQRKEYRNMWLSSERAYNNIRFAVGALLLNRIASAINAVRLVVKHNKQMKKEEVSWNIYFGAQVITQQHANMTVNFVTTF